MLNIIEIVDYFACLCLILPLVMKNRSFERYSMQKEADPYGVEDVAFDVLLLIEYKYMYFHS